MMEFLLDQIEAAVEVAPYVAAKSALTVPDIAGKVAYSHLKSAQRYVKWFDQWMGPTYAAVQTHLGSPPSLYLDGASCYAFRCKLLHEASGAPNSAPIASKPGTQHVAQLKRIGFAWLETGCLHKVRVKRQTGDVLLLDAKEFATDMITEARKWLGSGLSRSQRDMLDAMMHLRDGLPPEFSNVVKADRAKSIFSTLEPNPQKLARRRGGPRASKRKRATPSG